MVQQLAIHPLGNFAFQQMYQNSEPPTRLDVLSVIDMYELALNQHGTRSAQRIILVSDHNVEQEDAIREQFTGKVADLITSSHGNHCIQKIIETFKPEQF